MDMSLQGLKGLDDFEPLVAIQFVIEVQTNPGLPRVPDGPGADRSSARTSVFPFWEA